MDLQAITKPSGPVSSEAFDEREVYPCVRKSFGFHFLDTLPVKVFRLLEADREHFLGKPLCERLKRDTDDWDIYRISNVRKPLDERNPEDLAHCMALAYRQKAGSCKDMPATPDDPKSLGYNWKHSHSTDLKLPKADRFDEGTLISVFNSEKSRTLPLKNHEEKTHLSLKPWKGLILERTTGQNGKPVWRKGAEFGAVKDQYIQSNPLVFDIPRVFDTSGQPLPCTGTEGELYPTTKVVQDLFQRKHGTKPEVFRNSEQMIPWLEVLEEDTEVSFIVQHSFAAHMIAARIIRKGNHLVCYLHETLDSGNKHSEGIYEEVTKALESAFPTINRVMLSPAFESQKDFSSCGVFTEKTLKALAKPGNGLDEWLLKQAKVPDTPSPVTPEVKKSKTSHLMIDLEEYPAVLLKLYQGPEKDLDIVVPADAISPHAGQNLMAAVVHRKKVRDGIQVSPAMTLKEYRAYHSHKKTPNDTGIGTPELDSCLVSTGKRYKMLMQWRDHFLTDTGSASPETDSPSLLDSPPPRKRSFDCNSFEQTDSPEGSDLSSDSFRIKEEHNYSLSPDQCPPAAKKKSPPLPRKEDVDQDDGPSVLTALKGMTSDHEDSGSDEEINEELGNTADSTRTRHNIRERSARAAMGQSYKRLLTELPLDYRSGGSKAEILRSAVLFIQEKSLCFMSKKKAPPSKTGGSKQLTNSVESQDVMGQNRKDYHNKIERDRRAAINQWITELDALIPSSGKKKRPKHIVLTDTIAKVQELKQTKAEPLADEKQPDEHMPSRVGSPELMEVEPSHTSRKRS
ncbi:helix-loop-helix domain-containing protein [Endozoicomonas sp.]|uniref:helix-loop-helix domain-containing protein n=1 Tax=Endozoicomonas sp. TaxID=1892382 RepID=UPI003D9AE8D7